MLAAPPGATTARPRKVALVVGNAGYLWVGPLQNPRRDARATAVLLDALGFQAETVLDADRAGFEAALARLAQRAAGAEVALLAFAGHAIQRGGANWLIPVDADPDDGADAARRLVGLQEAVAAMAGAEQRVAMLDACRDDPMAGARPETHGLARLDDMPPDSLLCFATAPGRVALDGEGRHAPFTDALLDHLGTPGLDLRQVLTRVRRRVLMATSGRQIPWDNSSLTADLVLRAADLPAVPRPVEDNDGDRFRIPAPGPDSRVPFVDPARFREMPRTYEHATRHGFGLPPGLLVEQRSASGAPMPLTGAYFDRGDGRLGLLLISYDARSGEASYVLMRAGAPAPGWSLHTARLEGTVLRDVAPDGRLVRSVDLASGAWTEATSQARLVVRME